MIRIIDGLLLSSLLEQARRSPRRRQHFNLHEKHSEPCQRLLNAILPDSYIRPHRHLFDGKLETLIAVQGVFGVVIFSDNGTVTRTFAFGASADAARTDAAAVEIPANVWHSVVALSDDAVLLEVKAGPFNPDAAKELSEWAPAEGTDQGTCYLQALRKAIRSNLPTDK